MLSQLQDHLNKYLPFLKDKKLLLATSGGIDSMVMAELFRRSGYDISIAHCNFGLRGEESDGDENFVKEYANENNIPYFVTLFDTKLFASDNKLSVQVAARQLRYLWFDELLAENNLDFLLTAHHLDDSIETFLINFTRGTGLQGLTGIPQQNGKIVRPLLPFTRDEIERYANDNNILWREDSSNASDKYLRNKLRHDVVPALKALNLSFTDSFQNTLSHLQQAHSMVADASVLVYKQVVTEKAGQKHINIAELKRLPNYTAYIHYWLSSFGFTAWEDIYALVDAQSGKQIISDNFRLLKDRDMLILEPVKSNDETEYRIEAGVREITNPIHLKVSGCETESSPENCNEIYVDAQKLKFPLVVRKWRKGDYFYPLGMSGQKKKVSKYFKDKKLSLSEKEDTWILCSENQIVWIILKRADERFKTDKNTTQTLKIEVLNNE